jgi:hypothetical protein
VRILWLGAGRGTMRSAYAQRVRNGVGSRAR